jgi:hypothetical protein
MTIILTISSTKFSLNGIQYFKNYISSVAGNQITIFNCYEREDIKLDWTDFGNVSVNGVVYTNVADLQIALLPVIYTRASLGGGGGDFDLTISETGETPISNVNEIEFDGATVTDDGGGKVTVTVTGGGATPTLQAVTDVGNTVTDGTSTTTIGQGTIEIDNDEFECLVFYNNGDNTGVILNGSIGVAYQTQNPITAENTVYSNGEIQYRQSSLTSPISLNIPYTDEIDGNTLATREWVIDNAVGGATNLGYTASPTNGIVTSDTGTDATIPLATGTNAGLSLNDLTSALKTAYDTASTWVTNAGANIRATILTGLSTATATTILATDSILTAFGKLQGNLNTRTLPLISDGSVTSITGVNVPTIMYSFQIPANLLNDYNRLVSQIQVTKASGSGSSSISYHINNTNSLSGAVQIAISLLTSTIQFASLERKFKITGTELSAYPFAASAATDSQNSGASRSTTLYNTTDAIWFIVAVNPASVGESHFLESVEINARRRKTSL